MVEARSVPALLLAGFVAAAKAAHAVQANDPKCLESVESAHYSPAGSPPLALVATGSGSTGAPAGGACFASSQSATFWITVASTIQTPDDKSDFLGRFAAISRLRTIQYWSTTDHQWRPLLSAAVALASKSIRQPRADFSLAEVLKGEDLYYAATDTRASRPITYRLRYWPDTSARLVVETVNVDAITDWGITLYAPGGVQTLYFLEHRSPDLWRYYSITQVEPASFLTKGHPRSYINRTVAMYRQIVGLPTDSEPPPAP